MQNSLSKNKRFLAAAILISLLIGGTVLLAQKKGGNDDRFVTYIADAKTEETRMYWKDDHQQAFKSISNLKAWLQSRHQRLVFAMNGGMYRQDGSPQGLYIENGKTLTPLDTSSGNGNFYLKPNGVFYITKSNTAAISATPDFRNNGQIRYATQSGPMLLIDGKIHPAFKEGSKNLKIRYGVGILPDNRIVFAMSKKEISFYDFADYFRKLGCKEALYLDGFVSRTYLPEKNWVQTDGSFGVIIGIAEQRQ